MRVVKYAKYNRTKAPLFQVKTLIIEQDGANYVLKAPLSEAAWAHISSFEKKYEELKKVYTKVVPVECELSKEGVRFPWVNGKSVTTDLEKYFNNIPKLLERMKYYIDRINDYNQECVKEFVVSEEYKKVFGDTAIDKGMAVSPANIDAIFDNFLVEGDTIKCIDYEWTFDFLVPCDYIKYRTLSYYYGSNKQYFDASLSEEEYYAYFGMSKEQCQCYAAMEDNFQQYAHGKNRKYIYTNNYVKKNVSMLGIMKDPMVMAKFVESDEEIIRLNEELSHALNDSVNTHEKLHETIEELKETHEKLHTTTDELVNTHEKLHEAYDNNSELSDKLNKKSQEYEDKVKEIVQKDQHIANYQATIAKYHKMAKNPIFATKVVGNVVARKSKDVAKKVLPHKVQRGLSVLKNEGFDVFMYKVNNQAKRADDYQTWIEQNEVNIRETSPLNYNPLISVVVPVYNVADNMLIECIESVLTQTYTNFELCLVDDCSTQESVRTVLKKHEDNPKIKIKYREKNGHISRTTNDGIAMATGEFIGLMDCDDLLAPNALYEMVKMLNEKDYDFIYSDEDKIDEAGENRRDPFFKPDWSPDTFMSYMYTCHFSVFRKSLIDELGGLRIGYEGSQDYDLVLRVMEKTRNIGHVPKILYHWRMRKESTASDLTAKPYIIESTIKAKTDALERRGLKGKLTCIDEITQYRVTYEPMGNPLVSIIIPSKDNYEVLRQCIESIKAKTTYPNYEIVVVDNGSNTENEAKYREMLEKHGCTYFHEFKDFNFSYMCNKGASLAKGEYFLFLNDDIEIPDGQGEWLSIMTGQAQVSYTGAVGAKLVYPGTNLIQHVGVLNLPIGPGHAFHRFDDSLNFYWGRNMLDYNFSIVTGACLMVKASKFEEIERFDESLPVAYNDVELCFKLLEHGYYNVLRNDIKLVHHESISRGYDESPEKAARLLRERNRLYEMHPNFKGGYDPCYNPNLTKDKGDFSLDISRIKMVANSGESVNIDDYKRTSKIKFSIDCFEQGVDDTRVTGWAFPDKENADSKLPVKLLFIRDDKKALMVDTAKIYRPDVAGAAGNKKVALSGFECSFNTRKILDGGHAYRMCIMIGKRFVVTDKKFVIN